MVGRPALDRPCSSRRSEAGTTAARVRPSQRATWRARWRRERFADIEPEGFLDFQATRPHVSLDEGLTRHDRVAGERLLPRADSGFRPRRRAAPRRRAEPPVANLLRARHRPREGSGRRARRHARLAPRRRPAHAGGARHRRGERSRARGEPRAAALSLRGPDRDRRRAPATRAAARACPARACGRRYRITSRSRPALAPPGRSATASAAAARGHRSTRPSSPRRRTRTPTR